MKNLLKQTAIQNYDIFKFMMEYFLSHEIHYWTSSKFFIFSQVRSRFSLRKSSWQSEEAFHSCLCVFMMHLWLLIKARWAAFYVPKCPFSRLQNSITENCDQENFSHRTIKSCDGTSQTRTLWSRNKFHFSIPWIRPWWNWSDKQDKMGKFHPQWCWFSICNRKREKQ